MRAPHLREARPRPRRPRETVQETAENGPLRAALLAALLAAPARGPGAQLSSMQPVTARAWARVIPTTARDVRRPQMPSTPTR